MATAILMAKLDISVEDALAQVKNKRPFAEPNHGFIKQLKANSESIRNCLKT